MHGKIELKFKIKKEDKVFHRTVKFELHHGEIFFCLTSFFGEELHHGEIFFCLTSFFGDVLKTGFSEDRFSEEGKY